MRKIIGSSLMLFGAFVAAVSIAQVAPQTLGPNTVWGRLGTSAGPGQAIPFSVLQGNLSSITLTGDCTGSPSNALSCSKLSGSVVSGAAKLNGSGVISQAACADLSNGATGCSTATGTSGATIPLLNQANTWSGRQIFGALYNQSSAAYSSSTAGDWEYDGTSFANLPVASDRGIVPSVHFLRIIADQTGTNGSSAQTWFPGGGPTQYNAITGTSYFFDGQMVLVRSAGTTSHTFSIGIGGTAVVAFGGGFITCTSTAGVAISSAQSIYQATAPQVCTAASTAANENIAVSFSGEMRVATGGTIIPQFTYSVAPGGAPTIKAGAYFRLFPIGSNSTTNVGNWN